MYVCMCVCPCVQYSGLKAASTFLPTLADAMATHGKSFKAKRQRWESDQAAAANAGSAHRYRSAVHVLLSPGRVYSTAPPPNQGQCGTVFVMGLHNSGTHALIEYLSKYFSVAVQPRMKQKHRRKSNDGLLLFKTWQLWKHHVPLQTLALPTGAATGPATLLLTVRNIMSWLASMSRSPYELYPHPSRHRQRHSLMWLLKDVELHTEDAGYDLNPGPLRYSSAVEFWFAYIRGYLSGHLAPGGQPARVVVVRHEDILRRPQEVVDALAALGLPRNDADFAVIEQLETGYTRASRSDILQREERIPTWTSTTAVGIESEVRCRLEALGCGPYMEALGYPMLGTEREVGGEVASAAAAAAASDAMAQTSRMRALRVLDAAETIRCDALAASAEGSVAGQPCPRVPVAPQVAAETEEDHCVAAGEEARLPAAVHAEVSANTADCNARRRAPKEAAADDALGKAAEDEAGRDDEIAEKVATDIDATVTAAEHAEMKGGVADFNRTRRKRQKADVDEAPREAAEDEIARDDAAHERPDVGWNADSTDGHDVVEWADTRLDASAQTEPEQMWPVQQSRRTIRPLSFWDSHEGQTQLLWALVQQRVSIPAMPRVALNDAWPVLRIATRSSRRLIEFQPYWAFLAPSRGAEPNSRRVRARRGQLFHAF